MSFAAMMLVVMAIDAALGWPNRLQARIGHPVTWIGAMIGALDRRWNRSDDTPLWRKLGGVAAALVVIGATGGLAWLVQIALPQGQLGIVIGGVLAWPLVAVRSMHDPVVDVARPLEKGDLAGAGHAVSMIVGRDPARLDQAGVARATLESLAENTSDGIVAPLFWGVVTGLPGIAAYKAINTLDSMIGRRTPRHLAFGWASARIDDGVNLIPARLTRLIFAAVSLRPLVAMACMWRDARHHRSPNAGQPEAAMAGALGIRLLGPRIYDNHIADEPWVNADCPDPLPQTLRQGLALYRRAMLGCAVLIAVVAASIG